MLQEKMHDFRVKWGIFEEEIHDFCVKSGIFAKIKKKTKKKQGVIFGLNRGFLQKKIMILG